MSASDPNIQLLLSELRALRKEVAALREQSAPSPIAAQRKRQRKEPRIPTVAEYKAWLKSQRFG